MPRRTSLILAAIASSALVATPIAVRAQSGGTGSTTGSSMTSGTQTTTGSVGCAALAQAAANGLAARVNADNNSINPPPSVTSMTCLDNFFNGVGLNLITNLLDPTTLLQAVEGAICGAVRSAWNATIGQIQCGLTLTGFNLGFGGLGGGLSCPRLTFGGGGPPIATIGLGLNANGGLYINGAGMPPSGYILPNLPQGTY